LEVLDLLKSGQLTSCKELRISADLPEFPTEILKLADSLELLEMSGNRLSKLPDAFGQLKKLKVVFFNNNEFEAFPAVLAECPNLSMISFKGNRLKTIGENTLSPAIRWLILTDNQLEALPNDIGKLSKLQKLMLAGNQLQTLPNEMAACQNLELIRLSANRLQAIPDWLFSLPRLSWLAYSGNPCCETANPTEASLPTVDKDTLQLGEVLGEGASGVIYKGTYKGTQGAKTVAVKLFKGEVTSDGLPQDEMRACMAAGTHPNLVTVLGKLREQADQQAGLVFSFISPDYKNLGGPPSLESCTRDTYDAQTSFALPVVVTLAKGIASAMAHLHANGLTHGDLYAHNILMNEKGESILGDFGAASFYDPTNRVMGTALELLEVRAFGCLLEDMLDRCSVVGETGADETSQTIDTFNTLRQLQIDCMQQVPINRPLFSAICERIDFKRAEAAPGNLDVQWIHGSVSAKHNRDPDIQVHVYNEHTIILRQNMAVHCEAPFMFLLFGTERAMLLDTGATRSPHFFPLRQTVDELIEQWLQAHPRAHYPLVVAHTHLHRDHFEADPQFANRPDTVVVGKSLAATLEFYKFQNWPIDQVLFDLGDRTLQLLATPGHEAAEVSIYDPYTQILFSGDLFYPGRLYITDWPAFVSSIDRMIAFCHAHPISHILGCHIEMSIYPKLDYLVRTSYQPYERPLEMTVAQLESVRDAIAEIDGKPGVYIYNDYIIYNGIPDRYFSYEDAVPEAEPGDVC
jgi:glyoxylase-like metal-dependent hydrolase (beta-lactamase superfamily II)